MWAFFTAKNIKQWSAGGSFLRSPLPGPSEAAEKSPTDPLRRSALEAASAENPECSRCAAVPVLAEGILVAWVVLAAEEVVEGMVPAVAAVWVVAFCRSPILCSAGRNHLTVGYNDCILPWFTCLLPTRRKHTWRSLRPAWLSSVFPAGP